MVLEQLLLVVEVDTCDIHILMIELIESMKDT